MKCIQPATTAPARICLRPGVASLSRNHGCYTERVLSSLKRVLLWDFPRASWQYDVIVGVILLFIFLTPRGWFRDQPRTPQSSAISLLPGSYWLEPALLSDVAEDQQKARAASILQARYKKRQTVTQLQPIYNSERELQGFIVFTRP